MKVTIERDDGATVEISGPEAAVRESLRMLFGFAQHPWERAVADAWTAHPWRDAWERRMREGMDPQVHGSPPGGDA